MLAAGAPRGTGRRSPPRRPRHYSARDLARTIAFATLTAAPFLAFVLASYDSSLPGTVLAKMQQSGYETSGHQLLVSLFGGPAALDYDRPQHVWQPWGTLLVAGALAGLVRRPRRLDVRNYRVLGFAGLAAGCHAAPFVALGALAYPWYTFPLRVTLALGEALALVALARLATGREPGRPLRAAGGVVLAGLLVAILAAQAREFQAIGTAARRRDTTGIFHQLVYRDAGEWLAKEAGTSGWTFAAKEVGLLGYYSKMRCLDLLGLVSPETRPYAMVEPASCTVLRFLPEIYVASAHQELDPGNPGYLPVAALRFANTYRLVREFPSPHGAVRVYCRADLAWPQPPVQEHAARTVLKETSGNR